MDIYFLFEILRALLRELLSYNFAEWCSIFSLALAVWEYVQDTKKK